MTWQEWYTDHPEFVEGDDWNSNYLISKCDKEEICQYDTSCPFFAENCRHDSTGNAFRIVS